VGSELREIERGRVGGADCKRVGEVKSEGVVEIDCKEVKRVRCRYREGI
jgi:hypothetical protein